MMKKRLSCLVVAGLLLTVPALAVERSFAGRTWEILAPEGYAPVKPASATAARAVESREGGGRKTLLAAFAPVKDAALPDGAEGSGALVFVMSDASGFQCASLRAVASIIYESEGYVRDITTAWEERLAYARRIDTQGDRWTAIPLGVIRELDKEGTSSVLDAKAYHINGRDRLVASTDSGLCVDGRVFWINVEQPLLSFEDLRAVVSRTVSYLKSRPIKKKVDK